MGISTSSTPVRVIPAAVPVRDIPVVTREQMTMYGWLALGFILLLAWVFRAGDFNFSTAYMDESLYINYGRMFLSHHYQWPMDHPLRWTWGWYLWPAMAAFANKFGALAGVRGLAAVLGLVTVAATFGFARRLFSPAVGLASALMVAILGPIVFSSRIATRDCASIPFFALGLWAYAAAWQENKVRYWLAATACFMAAFLCKYVVAIFFPALVLLALKKGWKPVLLFCGLMTAACAAYIGFYWQDLLALREYGRQYHQLALSDPGLIWENYVTAHLDVWFLTALALVLWPFLGKKEIWKSLLLLLGAGIFFFFQWQTRADRDFWKHASYPLLFVTPLAMAGVLSLVHRMERIKFPLAASCLVVVMAAGVAWAGNSWRMEKTLNWASRAIWPDAEPILTYMDGRLGPNSRVLADDSIFGYYLQPPLELSRVGDPFFFKYKDMVGDPAYVASVRDGYFDYVLLDSGVGEEAQHLRAVLLPVLPERYQLRLHVTDAVLGHLLEVYERTVPPPTPPPQAPAGPTIQITWPTTGDTVATQSEPVTILGGIVTGAQRGWYVRVEVYTNKWYPQGNKVYLNPER